MRRNAVFPSLAVVLALAASATQAQQQQDQQPQAPAGGAASAPAPAAEPAVNTGIGPLFGAPFGDDHLFGDWGGARPWLLDRGIDLRLNWLTENAGNVTGGARKGFEFSGQVGLELDLDFDKIAHIPGLALHTMTVQGNGRSLSQDYLRDDLDAVQEIFGGRGNVVAHLVYLYGEWATPDNRVDIAGGWIPVGTYFASSPLYCAFMNVIICGNPHPLPVYNGELDWPTATWGAQIRYLPTPQTYVMAGAFEMAPDFGGASGWDLNPKTATGVSIPVEVGWQPSFGADNLIGHYKFGFDVDTSTQADQYFDQNGNALALSGLPGAKRSGRNMYYVLLDQMLARSGQGDTAGLIAFAGWIHADQNVSPLANHFLAGFVDTANAIGRPQDTFGFNWNWFAVSNSLTRTQELETEFGLPLTGGGLGPAYGIQTHEQTLELMYTAQVYHGVSIMPDIQYIIRPGGTSATRNALALGFRTNVDF